MQPSQAMSEQPIADGTARARLQSDRPIKSEAEDVLGFSGFANALALSLAEMAPEDGLVISVEGEWGSGKTSAIELTHRRLILRELARETSKDLSEIEKNEWAEIQNDWEKLIDTRRTHIIRFNPWNFSGQENLTRAFFGELGSVIGHPPNGPLPKLSNE
jgi:predicted KAP-like P-loop ATPase